MKIQIESIPHNCQRYDTVGDWAFEADGSLVINVSEMPDLRSMIGVAVHELFEAILCRQKGITTEQVDDWDLRYTGKYEEPGEDPNCPYMAQHIIANAVENALIVQLGLSWQQHERNVASVALQWEDTK